MEIEAMLYEKLDRGMVHCKVCAHECRIQPSNYGICGVRQNIDGTLYSLVFAECVAAHVDPVEKKPLYHFRPGTSTFSIATMGCNFKCGFCQNWQISQIAGAYTALPITKELAPRLVVELALDRGCGSISYTYTEPTVFFEYAFETAKLAHAAGLSNIFVTNGYMSASALDLIGPFLDAANVDLKSFNELTYRTSCRASLQPVLETIRRMKKMGIWTEITTLIIPGENDSDEELHTIAGFIAELDTEMPWHISRFHPDYRYSRSEPTPLSSLERTLAIGKKAGLKYVYLGNVAEGSDTFCPGCSKPLIRRSGYKTGPISLHQGRCTKCQAVISGVWN
ncbi:MAG TPA: AmmeMemoRadiSam system radical SAM enzyme [Candidatus Omnitrophota bacterium]|nr:AmmeMemoRadiSam system radical SAM enzyme [Candidatus Omnitrophota bacterium]